MAELVIVLLLLALYPSVKEGLKALIVDIVRLLCIPLSWIAKLFHFIKSKIYG